MGWLEHSSLRREGVGGRHCMEKGSEERDYLGGVFVLEDKNPSRAQSSPRT